MALTLPAAFHWSPRSARPGIHRHGLRPAFAPCLSAPDTPRLVCLAFTPATAWAKSGARRAEPGELWDLWQVRLDDTDRVHPMPFVGRTLLEVRVANRIPKSRVWWVGERCVS